MENLLIWVQLVSGIILTVLILMQVKGVGFGRVWGSWTTSFSRRGLESFVFKSTFVLAAVFTIASIAQLVI